MKGSSSYNNKKKDTSKLQLMVKLMLLGGGAGVSICGDLVLHYFWCGFAVILILNCGIVVSKY